MSLLVPVINIPPKPHANDAIPYGGFDGAVNNDYLKSVFEDGCESAQKTEFNPRGSNDVTKMRSILESGKKLALVHYEGENQMLINHIFNHLTKNATAYTDKIQIIKMSHQTDDPDLKTGKIIQDTNKDEHVVYVFTYEVNPKNQSIDKTRIQKCKPLIGPGDIILPGDLKTLET